MPATASSPLASDIAGPRRFGARILAMLDRQLAALEAETEQGGYSEACVKALQLLVKTIEAAAEMAGKQEQADAERNAGPDDILEFRNELARRIDALGEGGLDGTVR